MSIDSLRASTFLNEKHEDYESVVESAIMLGEDTDPTAFIAGVVAGLRFGAQAISIRWRENLRGTEIYQPLIEKLIAHLSK